MDIDETDKIGYLGYRVGQAHTDKGIANKALKLLVETVNDEGVKQIKAKTTTNNKASQRVLEKNGFEGIVNSREEFEMNGKMLKFVYYNLNISS